LHAQAPGLLFVVLQIVGVNLNSTRKIVSPETDSAVNTYLYFVMTALSTTNTIKSENASIRIYTKPQTRQRVFVLCDDSAVNNEYNPRRKVGITVRG